MNIMAVETGYFVDGMDSSVPVMQVEGGVREVGIFLCDGFALLGHAEPATHGPRWQGRHEPVRGAGAS